MRIAPGTADSWAEFSGPRIDEPFGESDSETRLADSWTQGRG